MTTLPAHDDPVENCATRAEWHADPVRYSDRRRPPKSWVREYRARNQWSRPLVRSGYTAAYRALGLVA